MFWSPLSRSRGFAASFGGARTRHSESGGLVQRMTETVARGLDPRFDRRPRYPRYSRHIEIPRTSIPAWDGPALRLEAPQIRSGTPRKAGAVIPIDTHWPPLGIAAGRPSSQRSFHRPFGVLGASTIMAGPGPHITRVFGAEGWSRAIANLGVIPIMFRP